MLAVSGKQQVTDSEGGNSGIPKSSVPHVLNSGSVPRGAFQRRSENFPSF